MSRAECVSLPQVANKWISFGRVLYGAARGERPGRCEDLSKRKVTTFHTGEGLSFSERWFTNQLELEGVVRVLERVAAEEGGCGDLTLSDGSPVGFFQLSLLYMAFTQDHSVRVDPALFPSAEVAALTKTMQAWRNAGGGEMSLGTQLEKALELTDGKVWLALHTLAMSWRTWARDADPQLSRYGVNHDEAADLLQIMPQLDAGVIGPRDERWGSSGKRGGSAYHLWTEASWYAALTAIDAKAKACGSWCGKDMIKHVGFDVLMRSANWGLETLRVVLGNNELDFGTHPEAQAMGKQMGKWVGEKLDVPSEVLPEYVPLMILVLNTLMR